jgi:bacillithiol biosynthesis cysteine-adding enzyme BshC
VPGIRLEVRQVPYVEHPGFGPGTLLARLGAGEDRGELPLLSAADRSHTSASEFLDREALAQALAGTGERTGRPLSEGGLKALREDGRLVLTGHQPVILGGPLFTFLKAVSVLSLADLLGREPGAPLVPAFWVATEDHDILEANRCTVSGRKFVCPYEGPVAAGRVPPLGRIDPRACRKPLLAFLEETLPESEFRPALLKAVTDADFSDYGSLFATLLRRILGPRELVIVDPMDLRMLSAPVLADAVERWQALEEAFEKGSGMLRNRGFAPPLRDIGLFEIREGGRVKCTRTPEGFELSVGERGLGETAEEIRRRPSDFSPSAGLRPVLQDAVLPVLAYVGGGTELLYLWQIDPLYDVLGITRSRIHPRVSATFLEAGVRKAAEKAGLYPDGLWESDRRLEDTRSEGGDDAETRSIERLGAELADAVSRAGLPRSRRWLDRSAAALRHQTQKIVRRLTDDKREEEGRGRQRIEKVAAALLPSGKPQERVANVLEFLARYGPEFIDRCLASLDPLAVAHQIADIRPAHSTEGESP